MGNELPLRPRAIVDDLLEVKDTRKTVRMLAEAGMAGFSLFCPDRERRRAVGTSALLSIGLSNHEEAMRRMHKLSDAPKVYFLVA